MFGIHQADHSLSCGYWLLEHGNNIQLHEIQTSSCRHQHEARKLAASTSSAFGPREMMQTPLFSLSTSRFPPLTSSTLLLKLHEIAHLVDCSTSSHYSSSIPPSPSQCRPSSDVSRLAQSSPDNLSSLPPSTPLALASHSASLTEVSHLLHLSPPYAQYPTNCSC